jgi:hypothetical protein
MGIAQNNLSASLLFPKAKTHLYPCIMIKY